jgi:hypothetical protein
MLERIITRILIGDKEVIKEEEKKVEKEKKMESQIEVQENSILSDDGNY